MTIEIPKTRMSMLHFRGGILILLVASTVSFLIKRHRTSSNTILVGRHSVRELKKPQPYALTSFLDAADLADTHNSTLREKAEAILALQQQSSSVQSGATGSLFSGKAFRTFPDEPHFRDWKPRTLEVSSSSGNLRSDTTSTTSNGQTYRFFPPPHDTSVSSCSKWSVVTTIFAPSEAVLRAAQLSVHGWCLVIVADLVTPADYLERAGLDQNPSVHFLSVEYQQHISSSNTSAVGAFVGAVPWRHFSRKNIGYLYAMANQAEYIFDFDDDNILDYADNPNAESQVVADPVPTDWNAVRVPLSAKSALNHHPLMGLKESWPRGFPLDAIQDKATQGPLAYDFDMSVNEIPNRVAVMQYCVNGNPDVDAIHRLVKPLPLTFEAATSSSPLMIPPYTFVPYNAQATVHTAQALFATLLPSTVPGRVSDIWRSYFAQVLFFPLDLAVTFLPPRIVQDRNEHSYLGDFRAELDLYFKAGTLVDYLSTWEPATTIDSSDTATTVPARMEELWINLYERGYIELDDVRLLQLWLAALTEIGYKFPEISNQRHRRHHNVVVMGQFNYVEPADTVVFWTQQWRQLFSNIVVRGPFNDTDVTELRARGVQVYESADDLGFYSPMTNLGETLMQHYQQQQSGDASNNDNKPQRRIDGVLYIHDDAMLNMSAVLGSGKKFSNDTILGTLYSDWPYSYQNPRSLPNSPDLLQYSFQLNPDRKFSIPRTDWKPWHGWRKCTPGIRKIMTLAENDPEYGLFLEPDGSFVVPSPTQADFLYVPVQYAQDFFAAARLVAEHHIFLECGFAIIVDYVMQQHGQRHGQSPPQVRTVELCTSWSPIRLRGTDQMYDTCRDNQNIVYGIYHPFKVSKGLAWWSDLFRTISFGDGR